MTPERDRDIAAVVLLALEHSGLPIDRLAARVEAELMARSEVEPWLSGAALAKSRDDVVAVLKEVAGAHPLLRDMFAVFDVLARVRGHHRGAPHGAIRFVLGCWYDGKIPSDLSPFMDDLYEDGFCAHEYEEVQPELASRALDRFLAAARGRTPLASVIAEVADAGWV